MVFEASASRSMSASACDELVGRGRRFGEEALDRRDQLLHLLPVGIDVELGAAELIRVAGHDALERADEALAERIGAVADDRRRLVPAGAQRAHLLEQIGRGAFRRIRRERLRHGFELGDQLFAIGLLRLELDLVAPLVAIEERVARGAEALPDRLRLVAADRADGLPLALQAADLAGRPVPVA